MSSNEQPAGAHRLPTPHRSVSGAEPLAPSENGSRREGCDGEKEYRTVTTTIENLQALTVVQLVRLAQEGDREAFGELFERYRVGIVAQAMRRMRNADEAEELAQDVFIQAMEKIDQLRVPEAFGGWLRRIVHRMAINRATRRQAALACDPVTLEATCFASGTPDDVALQREEAAGIQAAVAQLGDVDRETLKAFYMNGQSLLEMSDAFDAPVGTIKRRLHTARKRLAKRMDMAQAV